MSICKVRICKVRICKVRMGARGLVTRLAVAREASDGTCRETLGTRDSGTEFCTCDIGRCTEAGG